MHMTTGGAPRSILPVFGLLLASGVSTAQFQPRLSVSTTSNVSAMNSAIGDIDDGAMTLIGDGAPIRPMLASGNWLAVTGFIPADIDGFARRPGFAPGSAPSIVFSLLSNEGGFLDGDVITLLPGAGAEVLIAESEITTALGVPGVSIDVNAISFDDVGRLYFSLQADLAGTAIGDISDGDVLRLDSPTQVSVVVTETQVQNQFSAATGLGDAIGDVQGLEWFGGEIWVATQSPSSHDGAVFRAQGIPEVIIEEAQVGLGGAELDAICFARPGDEIVAFTLSLDAALPGEAVQVEAYGRPGELLLVLPAGNAGFVDYSAHPGFGGFYLDPFDALLQSVLMSVPNYYVTLDGAGRFSATWHLPPGTASGAGPGGEGWSVQVVGIANREPSAPWRVMRL